MSSPQTTTPDLEAVARAIREHDRFLVTTHENPDGDALGSLLATKLALESLGKDAVICLYGEAPLPTEYEFMPLDDLVRGAARPTRPSACSSRSTARTPPGSGPGPTSCQRAPLVDRRRPPPRQHALRRRQPDRRGRVVDRRGAARRVRRARRRAHARRSRRRSTSRSSPTRAASSTRTRRRRRCGSPPSWSRPARTSTASSRPSTRRSQFAKLKLLARALERAQVSRAGGSCLVPPARATSPSSGRPSRTRRGSSTPCARSTAPRWRR